jgi:hypothetical protein
VKLKLTQPQVELELSNNHLKILGASIPGFEDQFDPRPEKYLVNIKTVSNKNIFL